MRTTQTKTISLPPKMVEEIEFLKKSENRTTSELIREALRFYINSRFPSVKPTKEELAMIRRGRQAYVRGEYISLNSYLNDMEPHTYKTRNKGSKKTSRKR